MEIVEKKQVNFIGDELTAVKTDDGNVYVAMKPICEYLGLGWGSQYQKIQSNEALASTVTIIDMVAEDGKKREMTMLNVRMLPGWLMTIHPNKVNENLKTKLITYQKEAAEVLAKAFIDHKTPESMSLLHIMKHSVDTLIKQDEKLKQLDSRVSQVEASATQEAISAKVKAALKNEEINIFPEGCTTLDKICGDYFKGFSKSVVSLWLKQVKHPTGVYKFQLEDNIIREVLVYRNSQLQEAYDRLSIESKYEKATANNDIYYHPIIGRYYVKRGA